MNVLRRRTWAEVSLKNIEHNYRIMREKLPAGCRFLAVVKADAYGHGADRVAPMLEGLGVDYFAVAEIGEAKALRGTGISAPIMIFGYTDPEFADEIIKYNITQEISSFEMARGFSRKACQIGCTVRAHLKLDSGMGRLGFDCKDGNLNSDEILAALRLPGIDYEGVFTHFAVSDIQSEDCSLYTNTQYKNFMHTVSELEERWGHRFLIRHCANSGAMISHSFTYADMVRPGISLYGLYPGSDHGNMELLPAMELKTRIVQIKEFKAGESVSYGRIYTTKEPRKIAVIPVGYADGLHRVLSNKIDVLLHGRRVNQVGRICMDMCMIDITDVPDVQVGDIVTIFGHDGNEYISVDEQAEKAGTISYEMLCSVSKRVPRVYD